MHRYGSNAYAVSGQEHGTPPRLRTYEEHAKQMIASALATSMSSAPFYMWILDADGRERLQPFSSAEGDDDA